MNKDEVLIGGDPEFFIANAKGIVPSCGLIGGTKKAGIPIPALDSVSKADLEQLGFTWLEDNVTVEVNFKAHNNSASFSHAMSLLKNQCEKALAAKGLKPKWSIPSWEFTPAQLASEQAQEIGCDPDRVAYEPDVPRKIDIGQVGNNRFTAGHIHLSYPNPSKLPPWAVALLIDALVTLPLLKHDRQGLRRQFYGQAGSFRPKEYGLEYRTLSNFWMTGIIGTAGGDIHASTLLARDLLSLGNDIRVHPRALLDLFKKIPFHDVRTIINNEALKPAEMLCKELVGISEEYRGTFNFDCLRLA